MTLSIVRLSAQAFSWQGQGKQSYAVVSKASSFQDHVLVLYIIFVVELQLLIAVVIYFPRL